MSNYLVTDTDLTSVADAIREKGGTSAALEFPDGFVDAIDDIETGGGDTNPTAPENDVIFIDYDGTIRYSYTAAEFLALTELPANPAHDGLTAQGWNWTLADAKAYVASMGELVIGQLYVTSSGNTEIDLVLTPPMTSGTLGICINGTAEIDFGDGSTKHTLTGTSDNTVQYVAHDWGVSGPYTVKIKATGTLGFLGNSNGSYLFTNGTAGNGSMAHYAAVRAIRFGTGSFSLTTGAFGKLVSMRYITMSQNVTGSAQGYYKFTAARSLVAIIAPRTTAFANYDFQMCSSLKRASIGYSGGSFYDGCYVMLRANNYASFDQHSAYARFANCYSLTRISVYNNATYISGTMFKGCQALQKITIPSGVTTIQAEAFQNCYSLTEIHMLPTTVPRLSNTNAFTNVPATCIIYVPYSEDHSVLTEYQEATNWSTYASQMQEEPQ